MRNSGLRRLVLVATVIGAVGLFSLPWYGGAFAPGGAAGSGAATSVPEVDWTNADETLPLPPGATPESPSYDGDGTADGETTGPEGDGGPPGVPSPSAGPANGGHEASGGGLLGLAFPVQAAMSVGLLGLAFLALLPGRRMPADLR